MLFRSHDAEHALVPAFAVLRDLISAKMRTRGLGLVHENRSAWEIEIDNETNRSQVRRCVISLQTILEHYGRFSDFVVQKCTKAQPIARCMVEGAALLLSDLGVTQPF